MSSGQIQEWITSAVVTFRGEASAQLRPRLRKGSEEKGEGKWDKRTLSQEVLLRSGKDELASGEGSSFHCSRYNTQKQETAGTLSSKS